MKSTAIDRVIASTAPLLIEYAKRSTRPISEAFCDWVDDGMPPQAVWEQRHQDVHGPAEKLLGLMCHCTDVIPADVCQQLDIERGSTYARAAQRLLAEQRIAR